MVMAKFLMVCACFLLGGCFESSRCIKEAHVKTITSVDYRSATFLLDNGETVEFDQAKLKPGSTVCVKWSEDR